MEETFGGIRILNPAFIGRCKMMSDIDITSQRENEYGVV